MRCLYCGKELALLKRWTGGGEFCSDAHKQSYQEEYNRLALSRLLQAQAKGGEAKSVQRGGSEPGKPAPPAAPVAVEEPIVEAVAPEPEVEEQVPEMASFQIEKPALCSLEEAQPYVEPSATEAPAPLLPAWQARNGISTLSSAELIPLQFDGEAREQKPEPQLPPVVTDVNPKEIATAKVDWNLPYTAAASHEFPTADLIALDFSAARSKEPAANRSYPAEEFRAEVAAGRSELLSVPFTTVAFSADGAVNISDGWFDQQLGEPAPVETPAAPAEVQTWSEPEPTPRASLEALSRLHQDLIQQEENQEPEVGEPEPVMASGPVRVSILPAEEPAAAAIEPELEPAMQAVAVAEITVDVQPAAAEPEPAAEPRVWDAGELIEIPLLKSYTASKSTLLVEAGSGGNGNGIQLPRLKALPLRPKVGLAPPGAGTLLRTATPQSPAIEAKLKSAPAAPSSPKGPAKPAAGKIAPAPGSGAPAKPAATESAARATKVSGTKPAPVPPKPAAEQPAARAAETPRPPAGAESKPAKREEPQPSLTFEALELQLMTSGTSPGFLGSMKMKLSIAAVVVVLGILAYNFLGSKGHKPQPTEDTPGPSIMMGEGGWVQNWASDPANVHAGREITIYRPSLKLTDYRIDFQGQIDSKSIGWVFRAADSNNYYVMKLAMLGTALPLKVALFKYIVLNGRESEAGRVPLDIPVSRDTVYTVRIDVRGPKFNTYIQGQPVDVWTDDQLKIGGVGFLNERTERARIKTVSISYLTGGSK